MTSKIVEIVHQFRKKRDDELKRKMKKMGAVSFCLFSTFFQAGQQQHFTAEWDNI